MSRLISVDCQDYNEDSLKLPVIALTSTRSMQSQLGNSNLVMPRIEETKFLSMPMKSANREYRSVSANRGSKEKRSNLLNVNSKSPLSMRSTANNSTTSSPNKPCILTRHSARLSKVKQINRAMWEKDVIRDDERFARKGSAASSRAELEIADTTSYFNDCASDTVSQIQLTLNNLDEHCNERLEAMAAEERHKADMSARW